MTEDPLALDTRRRVFEHVRAHPGTHLRELQRQLDMSLGTLEYHLRVLEKQGLLSTQEDTRYLRYYATAQLGPREKEVIALLRQEVPRRVCATLLIEPGLNHKQLLGHFQLAASTLSFHLKKLQAARLLDVQREGREARYRILEPDLVAKCLVAYQASFLDEVVDRFAAAWLDIDAGAPVEEQARAPPGAGAERAAPDGPRTEEGKRDGDRAGVVAVTRVSWAQRLRRARRPALATATTSTAPKAPASTLGGSSSSTPCTSKA
ncbi:MAG: helix-turn-helix domain-containing protein [Halobacteriales archaeon]|nr:helix-turn-helix domain-containing protein [Halobacteriales archaeon]